MNILLAYVWSPYTTAAYYAKAFRQLGHDVRTVGPVNEAATAAVPEHQRYRLTGAHDNEAIPETWKADLFVWIEAGGGWWPGSRLPREPHVPTIAYFIDSHSHILDHMGEANCYDHVFVAQREYLTVVRQDAHWLPVACDPDVHTPTRTGPPEYDVAFVGNTYGDSPLYARRREVLAELAARYRCNFQSGVYFEDMANVYASARVAFNVSTGGDLNMRVFEAMCSGRPLVTDGVEGLGWLYEGGEVGPLAYANEADMLATIDSLLAEPISAAECGRFARLNAIARHTYLHRAQAMLQAVGL